MQDSYGRDESHDRRSAATPASAYPDADKEAVLHALAGSLQGIHSTLREASVLDSSYKEAAAARALRISELIREKERLERDKERLLSDKRTLTAELSTAQRHLRTARSRLKRSDQRRRQLREKLARAKRREAELAEELDSLGSRRSVKLALRLAEFARPAYDAKRALKRG